MIKMHRANIKAICQQLLWKLSQTQGYWMLNYTWYVILISAHLCMLFTNFRLLFQAQKVYTSWTPWHKEDQDQMKYWGSGGRWSFLAYWYEVIPQLWTHYDFLYTKGIINKQKNKVMYHFEIEVNKEQGRSEGFDSCDRPSNLKLDSNGQFFRLCDREIWWMTSKNNRALPLYYVKLCASFQIHWWIQAGFTVRKRSIRVQIGDMLCPVTLKFDGRPWKTIGHLFYAPSSFAQHSYPLVNSNWSYSPEMPNLGQIRRFF